MVSSGNIRKQVQRVLWITLFLNLGVALGKIALGLMSGALAITADGFHSLADGAGNIAGLIGNWMAGHPPDDDHPYGHRRFETLAALFIGALLLLTAWELLRGVFHRVQSGATFQITPLTFFVLVLTLCINILVSRYQIRRGKELQSEILLADAKNTQADVFVTLSVMGSTALVWLTGWLWVDVVAALLVVVLIGRAAWEIVAQTGRILVDTAPYTPEHLTALVMDVPGICHVLRARSRGSLDAALIDLDVCVPPEMTADQSESITLAIRRTIQSAFEGVLEIEVHFIPYHPQGRDPVLTARAYADALGVTTHEVQVSEEAQGKLLEMHVEVNPQQTLADAHQTVSQLESDVLNALPDIDRVVTHIEPAQAESTIKGNTSILNRANWIQHEAEKLLRERYPHIGWHDLAVRPLHHGFAINLHAIVSAELSVQSAHHFAESAETLLRSAIPELSRVTIHTEPEDHE